MIFNVKHGTVISRSQTIHFKGLLKFRNLEIATKYVKMTKNRTQVFPDFANLKMHLTKLLSGSIVMIDCLPSYYVYLCVNNESFGSLNVGFI